MNSVENPPPNPIGVSVVICCYNGAARLPETLKHLARQIIPPTIPWEVIVVNNASTDDSGAVAVRVWQEIGAPAPLCLLEETRPGKSFALDTGYTSSSYGVLVTVDDDNWLDPDYLKIAFETISENPEVGAVGGKITAVPEVEPPNWFPEFQSFYAAGAQGKASGNITDDNAFVVGAGMVLRKSAYQELKRLNFTFSLTTIKTETSGGKFSLGEDTELCLALALCGFQIWYDERLNLRHFIPVSRLNPEYILRVNRAIMRGGSLLIVYWAQLFHPGTHPFWIFWNKWREKLWWSIKEVLKALRGESTWLAARLSTEMFLHHCFSLVDYLRPHREINAKVAIFANSGKLKIQKRAMNRTDPASRR